jgi:hypothetical protein
VGNKAKILAILEALDSYRMINPDKLKRLTATIPYVVDDMTYSHTQMANIDFGELYDWLGKATVTP